MHGRSCPSLFRAAVGAGIIAFVLALAGCASPPVQAMSNARQAIAAAEQAGAARYAPRSLAEARHWLADAEFSLKNGNYNRAHWSAVHAEKAARRAAAKARLVHPPTPASSAGSAGLALSSGPHARQG